MAKTSINESQMMDSLAEDLTEIIVAESTAREQAKTFKTDADVTANDSIRAIAKRFGKLNITLDALQLDKLVDSIADKAEAKGAPMRPSRKSELKTMLGQGRNLPTIIADLEKKQDLDSKSRFNIREKTIAAARKLRDDPNLSIKEAISQVIKAPMTSEEKARALTERLRKEAIFRVKVGDESMVDPDIEPVIKTLEDFIDGVRPVAIEDSEQYKALEAQLDGLRAALAAAGEAETDEELYNITANALGDAIVDAANNNWGSPTAGPEATQDGDEPETVPDSPETEEAAPASPDELAEAKKKALSPGLTGFADIDSLMNDLTGFKG